MESRQEFIAIATAALLKGVNRDDVYHECSKFSVLNGHNRYDVWVEIVTGASD